MNNRPSKPLNPAQKLLAEIKKENFLCFTDISIKAPSEAAAGKIVKESLVQSSTSIKYRASDKATKLLGLR